MKPGDIYLAMFPFGDAPGMKLRPVLALTGPLSVGPEVLVAYISSAIPATLLPTDIVLDPAQPAHAPLNLKVRSVLRLHNWPRFIRVAWPAAWERSRQNSAPMYQHDYGCS